PESATTCSGGKVYCLATGTCVDDGACGRPVGAAEGTPDLVCPPNKVFCLSSGTCKEAGACGGRPPESMATMCPRGYVYCLERGECVSANRGCNWESRNCPAGEVFSLKTGSCVGDDGSNMDDYDWLPDAKCPESSKGSRAPFTHSTCFSPLHCPFNHSCCPDPEKLHLQCVTPDGVSNPKTINISCLQLESKRHNTGINCTVPEDCPVASVCCGGMCKSSRGVETCPPGTLYCNLTKKCTRLGERCARVCAAGQFYCIATDECGPESACEFGMSSLWSRLSRGSLSYVLFCVPVFLIASSCHFFFI
ncbi:latent-transforming growth factor beta-binding protein 2-like, partial [Penaeus monodon]|uniref:latent-transforming growth factor beta-binding protein 2-like n=1 Tax=Penaeus monodon TaxID=6687 RepID=UPI0018A79DEA